MRSPRTGATYTKPSAWGIQRLLKEGALIWSHSLKWKYSKLGVQLLIGVPVNFLRGHEADLYLQAKVQVSKTASSYCKKGAVVQHKEQVYVSHISTILFVILFLDLWAIYKSKKVISREIGNWYLINSATSLCKEQLMNATIVCEMFLFSPSLIATF